MFSQQVTFAQCSLVSDISPVVFTESKQIIEGKIVSQESVMDFDGRIQTVNRIEVYRVLKGHSQASVEVVTEGGIFGDLMQIVTPSVQLKVGDYGVVSVDENSKAIGSFISINRKNGTVSGFPLAKTREGLYNRISKVTGSNVIELKRLDLETLKDPDDVDIAEDVLVQSVFPLDITAGTQSVITITGSGFGNEQGNGLVSFYNADDGGQSYVDIEEGPHYLSWSDTEIQLFVPSATLYDNMVAGTGTVRVSNTSGASNESEDQLTVKYAKSEVIYADNLNETMLVGMLEGGYEFQMNEQLLQLLSGSFLVEQALMNWACNSQVNFRFNSDVVNIIDWAHDDINLIGLSDPGQLPNYLLGRTVTTFSGCGTGEGLQWNLVEVDILLNADIDWWTSLNQPMVDRYDLQTALLHELGHAHLLQHNNNTDSPMYFQLTPGATRRTLHPVSDIEGGTYVSGRSIHADHLCGNQQHELFDQCNMSMVNGVADQNELNVDVYPNPFNSEFVLAGVQVGSEFTLVDVSGRSVFNGITSSDRTTISTSTLPTGIYLLKINSELGSSVSKLVKN